MTKKTRKEFFDYNEYRDRGMGYKWDTAFALSELQEGMKESSKESKKSLERLPQQDMAYIDRCFDRSIKHNKILEIQLNSLDHLGRTKEAIWGNFRGFHDMETVQIGEQYVDYADIRHVKLHDFRKWSADPTVGVSSPFGTDEYELMDQSDQDKLDEKFDDYFTDNQWME